MNKVLKLSQEGLFFMPKQKSNYAFIDSQNLNLAIRELGWRLDFRRFRVYLAEKYNVSLENLLAYKKKRPHKDETL